jgi:hypothetical protein
MAVENEVRLAELTLNFVTFGGAEGAEPLWGGALRAHVELGVSVAEFDRDVSEFLTVVTDSLQA